MVLDESRVWYGDTYRVVVVWISGGIEQDRVMEIWYGVGNFMAIW